MISKPNYSLEKPDLDRDASQVYEWLGGKLGIQNRQLIGSTYDGEMTPELVTESLKQSVERETNKQQLTWMIRADDKTIGMVWLNLEDTDDVPAPSAFIIIGDPAYRSKGIGMAAMKDTIRYAYCNLPYATLYSRYTVSNATIEKLAKKLGFEKDSETYEDDQGQKWQNVALVL